MSPLYDENGNEVQGALTPEEVKAIAEEKEKLANEIKAKEEELTKLKGKDMNFAQLRKATAEEREKWSADKRMMVEELEKRDTELEKLKSATIGQYKTNRLKELTGGDEELTKAVEDHFKILGEGAITPEQIDLNLRKAFAAVKAERETPTNPIHTYVPTGDNLKPNTQKKSFTETEAGMEFFAKNFPNTPTAKAWRAKQQGK